MRAPLKPETREAVVDLYKAGLSTHEIARHVGINQSTAYAIVRNAGIVRSKSVAHSLRLREQREEAYRLIAENPGISIRTLANKVGVQRSTAHNWLRDYCGLYTSNPDDAERDCVATI